MIYNARIYIFFELCVFFEAEEGARYAINYDFFRIILAITQKRGYVRYVIVFIFLTYIRKSGVFCYAG